MVSSSSAVDFYPADGVSCERAESSEQRPGMQVCFGVVVGTILFEKRRIRKIGRLEPGSCHFCRHCLSESRLFVGDGIYGEAIGQKLRIAGTRRRSVQPAKNAP